MHRKVVIIGSGPAGLTAVLYTPRANLEPLVIRGLQPGGLISSTNEVANYPGFVDGVGGYELAEQMAQQAQMGKEQMKMEAAQAEQQKAMESEDAEMERTEGRIDAERDHERQMQLEAMRQLGSMATSRQPQARKAA